MAHVHSSWSCNGPHLSYSLSAINANYAVTHVNYSVPFNYVFLSRLLYSAKGISATDILPVICLGSDVALNKSKFIIIIIIFSGWLSNLYHMVASTTQVTRSMRCGVTSGAVKEPINSSPLHRPVI